MASTEDNPESDMGSSSGGGSGDVFDVRRVRKLVELMDEHDLAEIVLQQGEQKMKLRRGGEPVAVAALPAAAPDEEVGAGAILDLFSENVSVYSLWYDVFRSPWEAG